MTIQLKILKHQTEALNSITNVLRDVRISNKNPIHQNPLIDLNDPQIKKNIADTWSSSYSTVPKNMQKSRKDNNQVLGIDAKLETGTGKTYIYSRLMYELNEKYGFNKFIILVPSTPIKEGTKNFIEANYSKQHFADLYPKKRLDLQVLNAQKNSSGRKMFPTSIAHFARGSRQERNKINALLMSDSMLLSRKTMEKDDYDQTLFGSFTQPYKALAETKPIVIIDEPHRFKRENKAFQCIEKKLKPQCIIRFGATFPDLQDNQGKDYNNLVYNLGASEAFNLNLVKGVSVQTLEGSYLDDGKIKLTDMKYSPRSCTFRNETTKKPFTMEVGDYLSRIDEKFGGIYIEKIWQTSHPDIPVGVTLSNGQVLQKGDIIYSSIYGSTYQELMLKQAINNHFKIEKENFYRENKIKSLSLFFIDSIDSYRGENGDGALKIKFEEMLANKIRNELQKLEGKEIFSNLDQKYYDFLQASLKDIKKTNEGYFSKDNSTKDEDIKERVEMILSDKEKLLSFKNESNEWNTLRFIFSKWTLREGWDNPNVFQIAKLRSSGSEISKLQEVGRGLRLPVDEYGNRLDKEQFYLTYLVDYSEKDFARKLVTEINRDRVNEQNLSDMIPIVAKKRQLSEEQLLGELLINGLIDAEKNVKKDKWDQLLSLYPEFNKGLEQGKVIDESKNESVRVKIRPQRFNEIKELWSKINEKYYLKLDSITDDELIKAVLDILKNKEVYEQLLLHTTEQKTKVKSGSVNVIESHVDYHKIDDILPYNEFAVRIQRNTGISPIIFHQALVEYTKEEQLPKDFFNLLTLKNFVNAFQEWIEKAFIKRFSYKKLGVNPKETALTYADGTMKEGIVQGNLGIMRDEGTQVPEKFLYDSFVYDSDKERETITRSDIEEVTVFGKIPRKSIQVPLYYGGTTSPDFMYVLKKKSGELVLNLIVETKDYENKRQERKDEAYRIESARVFFETLKEDGVPIKFEQQLKNNDIVTMIRKMLN